MSTEENKRVVQAFMDLFERSDITGLLDAMTEDAVRRQHLWPRIEVVI